MNKGQKDLRADTRFRVLRLLNENPQMSQRELADAAGISVGSAHYVLSALVEAGLVKLSDLAPDARRRRYAYVLTPRGVAELAATASRFVARKLAEYEALRAEIERLGAEFGLDNEMTRRDAGVTAPAVGGDGVAREL